MDNRVRDLLIRAKNLVIEAESRLPPGDYLQSEEGYDLFRGIYANIDEIVGSAKQEGNR